jgi:fatty-acyl-CoA synthase
LRSETKVAEAAGLRPNSDKEQKNGSSRPTPTDIGTCARRLADFATLGEALDYAARSPAGFNFYSGRGELLEALTYRDLRDGAVALARRMLRAGLNAGDGVALIAETNADFMRAFFACQYASLVPVPLPPPVAFGGRVGYVEHIRSMLAGARVAAALAPEPFLDMVRQAAEPFDLKALGTLRELEGLPESGTDLPPIRPDQLSYLQFSSGSTRSPTGVAVTHRALMANARGIARDALQLRAGDRATSWLPFYHDMGLVGFVLTPLASQVSTDYIPTGEFARRPLVWPTLIAQNRATIAYSPSFGYELCTLRAVKASLDRLDLSSWRVAGVGGDMIRPAVLGRFADAFHGCGFRKAAFMPSYGMAEITLGITFGPLDRGVEVDRIDLNRLQTEGRAVPVKANGNGSGNGKHGSRDVREFVLCGRVLPGHELEVHGTDGSVLAEREVGRIMIRGPSMMRGYFSNPEETERVLSTDGWLDTGDLGYLLGGSLVITGRSKDLMLVNGRNVWPHDLEWAAEQQIEEVRPGDVVAFSVDGAEKERVVLLVQCRLSDAAAQQALRRKVAEVVLAAAGLDCTVVLVPQSWLPRTSSGKLSRTRAREQYLASLHEDPQSRVVAMNAPQDPSRASDPVPRVRLQA